MSNYLYRWYSLPYLIVNKAAPLLKLLVAGFPPRQPGFAPGSGQVGFVVDKVALG
jgi:hypothetical protein